MKPATEFMNINDIRWTEVDDTTAEKLDSTELIPWNECRALGWINQPGNYSGPSFVQVVNGVWIIDGLDINDGVTHFMRICAPEAKRIIPPNVFCRDGIGFESSDGKSMGAEFYYCWRARLSEFPKLDWEVR